MVSGFTSRPTLPSKIVLQETSVEKHRTGGMIAIAILNIILGVLEILNGLFQLTVVLTLIYNQLQLGFFEMPGASLAFSLLLLATGTVGLIAGIGMLALHPWARTLSLVFGGLLIVSSAASYFIVPIIASIGTYDLGSISAEGLARLIVFSTVDVILPVPYALILFVVFSKPLWKSTFAKGPD
jgi:hypothetical protein